MSQRSLVRPSGNVEIAQATKLVCRMSAFPIALPNIRFPATPEESVALAEYAIAQTVPSRAGIICFPECFIRKRSESRTSEVVSSKYRLLKSMLWFRGCRAERSGVPDRDCALDSFERPLDDRQQFAWVANGTQVDHQLVALVW